MFSKLLLIAVMRPSKKLMKKGARLEFFANMTRSGLTHLLNPVPQPLLASFYIMALTIPPMMSMPPSPAIPSQGVETWQYVTEVKPSAFLVENSLLLYWQPLRDHPVTELCQMLNHGSARDFWPHEFRSQMYPTSNPPPSLSKTPSGSTMALVAVARSSGFGALPDAEPWLRP